MQQVRQIDAKRTHFGRGQVIAFHAKGLRIAVKRFDRQFDVVRMSEFVVGIHKHDELSRGMLKREPFPFLHIFSIVVQDCRAVPFCDVPRLIG